MSYLRSPHRKARVKYSDLLSHEERRRKWLSATATALSNFSAQYNFQSIAVSLIVMSSSVCTLDESSCQQGEQQAWVKGTANAVIFVGAVIGQLGMGFLGDYMSRNAALAVTLSISSLSAMLSAVASVGSPSTVYATIIACRFVIGIGLGGIFPLSATKASEDSASSATTTNSAGSAFAFLWQVPGLLSPWVLGLVLTYSALSVESRWRLILGIGALFPALAVLCLALEAQCTQSSKCSLSHKCDQDVEERDATRTGARSPPSAEVSSTPTFLTVGAVLDKLRDPTLRGKLLACGGTWLLYDITFYGLSLLGGVVLSSINAHGGDSGGGDVSADASLRRVCRQQSTALALGLLLILLSGYLLPYLSLKYLQLLGFFVQAFFLALLVDLFTYLKGPDSDGLFALYCLALMSLQLGVPVTTYGLPASVFEKDIRCTFNGIASAMGKLGAIIGAYTFYYIAQASLHAVLIICVAVSLVGAYITQFYIDDASFAGDEGTASRHGPGLSKTLLSIARARGRVKQEAYVMFSPLSDSSLHSTNAERHSTHGERSAFDDCT